MLNALLHTDKKEDIYNLVAFKKSRMITTTVLLPGLQINVITEKLLVPLELQTSPSVYLIFTA